MGWISTVFVHKALDAAVALESVDPDVRTALFESVGLDAKAPVDPSAMISDGDFFGLLERLADLDGRGRSVPVHMGASMRCDDYGAFGLAFKSAPDLLGSYARVERYGKVVTSIANFRVERSGTSVFMEVIQGRDRRLGLEMTNELALAAAMSISREVSDDDFSAVAVHLMSDRPADDSVYQEHFRCPIHFGADRDALEVLTAVASRTNRLSDDGMSKFFESHLDSQLSQINDTTELERRVLDQIGDALSEGVPTLAEVAGRLRMSTRTLQRRLSADGLAYQDLVLDARKSLSEQLLRRTEYALAEFRDRPMQGPRRFGRGHLVLLDHAGLAVVPRGTGVKLGLAALRGCELHVEGLGPGRVGSHLINVIPKGRGDLIDQLFIDIGAHDDSNGGVKRHHRRIIDLIVIKPRTHFGTIAEGAEEIFHLAVLMAFRANEADAFGLGELQELLARIEAAIHIHIDGAVEEGLKAGLPIGRDGLVILTGDQTRWWIRPNPALR